MTGIRDAEAVGNFPALLSRERAVIRAVPHFADAGQTQPDDAHGRAALLLVETLIHALIERSLLTVDQAIGIVNDAAEVQEDLHLTDPNGAQSARSCLLKPMSSSLRWDVGA